MDAGGTDLRHGLAVDGAAAFPVELGVHIIDLLDVGIDKAEANRRQRLDSHAKLTHAELAFSVLVPPSQLVEDIRGLPSVITPEQRDANLAADVVVVHVLRTVDLEVGLQQQQFRLLAELS